MFKRQRNANSTSAIVRTVLVALAGVSPAWGESKTDVVVRTVEEDSLRGQLVAFSVSRGLALARIGGNEKRVSIEDIVRIQVETGRSAMESAGVLLILVTGDRINGEIVESDDDSSVVESASAGRIRVPLESIARLEMRSTSQAAHQIALDRFRRASDSHEDRVLLTNGDVVRGFITALTSAGVSIDTELGERVIPDTLLVAARFVSTTGDDRNEKIGGGWDGASRRRPPRVAVSLLDGSRLTFDDLDWSGQSILAKRSDGQRVEIDPNHVVRIDVLGGRWEWLTRHQPISFAHTPMLRLPWEFAKDRNVLGGPMIVAGQKFDHGLGVHTRSVLTYELKGAYRWLVTSFGMDDDSGSYADVTVRILVDGRPRFEREHVKRGELFGPVRLDVTKANRIELIADFGDNGDMQDRFNWVEPALVR